MFVTFIYLKNSTFLSLETIIDTGIQCLKLAVARLPKTTKTSFGNHFLRKIKG